MTLEESQLIDKYEVLFAQAGWKELVEDLAQKRVSMAQGLLEGADPDIYKVGVTRGLAAGYQYIIGLENHISAWKSANNEDLPDVDNGQ